MTKCNTLKGAQAEKGFQSTSDVKVGVGRSHSLDFIPVSLNIRPNPGAADEVWVSSIKSPAIPASGIFDIAGYDLHIWTAEVRVITSAEKFIIDQILTPDEVARASRFKFSKDRDLFISARAVLRLVLSQYLNLESRDISFAAGPYGKPLLSLPTKDLEQLRRDIAQSHKDSIQPLDFNVSHSGSRVLIGISRSDVGVDIEQIELDRNYDAIATRYFSEFERNTIASLSGVEKSRAFYNTWSRKEAFLKALGIGLSDHLDGFDVEAHPDRAASILAIRAAGGEWGEEKVEDWRMYDLEADKSYTATAVVRTAANIDSARAMAMEIADLIII